MEDNYLDNVFREKLELPQHHDFDEAAWLDLESRLEEKPNRKIIWWRWVAAAGILLPMLLSSFYFYHQLKQTELQLANLETKMNRFLKKDAATNVREEEANMALAENAQTTHQTTDNEVFATTSNPTNTPNYTEKKGANTINTSKKSIDNNQPIALAAEQGINHVAIKNTTQNTPQSITESVVHAKTYGADPTYLATNNEAYTKAFPVPKTNTIDYKNWISKERTLVVKENVWTQTKESFTPYGFEIGVGLQGGIVLSQTLSSKPFFRNEGVKAAVNLVNGVDLTLGANYAVYSYETQSIEPDFPNVQPENPDDIFKKIKVDEYIAQVPVGLKYNFGYPDDVFSPFVEIGGIAKKSLQKTYKHQYSSISTPNETYSVSPKPQKIKEGFAMNTATASVGVKWNPNLPKSPVLDNIIVQAEIFGNADFETENTQWMAGLGVSMSYAF